jgi:hypothetical protein
MPMDILRYDCDGDGYLDWTCDSVSGVDTSSWIKSSEVWTGTLDATFVYVRADN